MYLKMLSSKSRPFCSSFKMINEAADTDQCIKYGSYFFHNIFLYFSLVFLPYFFFLPGKNMWPMTRFSGTGSCVCLHHCWRAARFHLRLTGCWRGRRGGTRHQRPDRECLIWQYHIQPWLAPLQSYLISGEHPDAWAAPHQQGNFYRDTYHCCIYADWVISDSGNGLAPVWWQAITWANSDLLPHRP